MIRHVVMFKLSENLPDGAVAFLEHGLSELSTTIPEIETYQYGPDLALRDGNFDYCLVAEFEDAAAFERYVDHPKHRTFIKDRVMPVVSQRIAVQYEI